MNPYNLPAGMTSRHETRPTLPRDYATTKVSSVKSLIRKNRWKVNLYARLRKIVKCCQFLLPLVLLCLLIFMYRLVTMMAEAPDHTTQTMMRANSIAALIVSCLSVAAVIVDYKFF